MQQSQTGKSPTAAQLTELYPYCPTYWLQYCKALSDAGAEDAERAIQRAAATVPDRMKLYSTLNGDKADWIILMRELEAKRRQREKEREAIAHSLDIIDEFLQVDTRNISHDGTDDDIINETYNLDNMPQDEAADGPEAEADEAVKDEQDSLIDNFLAAERNGALFVPEAIDKGQWAANDDLSLDKVKERAILTESLAKVYVRQGKYAMALTIFRDLEARYSSESVSYFSDQIRFLERAIELLNENKQKK